MGWKRKWAKDTLKSFLPLQDQLRSLKRRLVPYQTRRSFDEYTFQQGLEQVTLVRQTIGPLDGKVLLELGVGWQPTIPLLFRVAGAQRIILADLERLMDVQTFMSGVQFLLEQKQRIASVLGLDVGDVEAKLKFRGESSLEQTLAEANMQYSVPFDPTSVLTDSVDIVTSRAVLEHIPPKTIESLLLGFERLLKPDGVMCHIIDNSDHWEHDDKSISRVNFLKYDDNFMWALGLNVQNYQNRLRHSEYVELFERCGYEVLDARGEPDASALQALETLPLCERYRNSPHEELAILTTYIVAQNARAAVLQSLRGPALAQAMRDDTGAFRGGS